jgi:hypothetical protein
LKPYRDRLTQVRVDANGIGYNFALNLRDEKFRVEFVHVGLRVQNRPGAGRSKPALLQLKGTVLPVVAQNLIRADGNAGELPGRANAVDFESGKRRRDGYIALFLSRSTRRQRDASLRERTQRTADGFFDCLG